MSGLLPLLGDYGWWIAGLGLLLLEIVLPGVYLLFPGLAALVVGTNQLLLSSTGWFGWQQQVVAFIAVTVVAVAIGRRWYGTAPVARGAAGLNQRGERMIGRIAVLSDAIVNGRGRIAIEDTWWPVEGADAPRGARMRIVGVDGSILRVAPAPAEAEAPAPRSSLDQS